MTAEDDFKGAIFEVLKVFGEIFKVLASILVTGIHFAIDLFKKVK